MCYSLHVKTSIAPLSKRFMAQFSENTELFFRDQSHKIPSEDGRVFKNYYCPAIIWRNNTREIVPLRFNLLPNFSTEDKYTMTDKVTGKKKELSTYNAKIENLQSARAYKSLFMRHHCIIPLTGFYEWGINQQGIKTNFKFSPNGAEFVFAAGLWDHWTDNENNKSINSFSIITTVARPEVLKIGHTRSPLLLPEASIDSFINVENSSQQQMTNIMGAVDSNILDHSY